MGKSIKSQVIEAAHEILRMEGGEIQRAELRRRVAAKIGKVDTEKTTVEGIFKKLHESGIKTRKADNKEVFFSLRGRASGSVASKSVRAANKSPRRKTEEVANQEEDSSREKRHYGPFAKQLKDWGECTKASGDFGDKRGGSKWMNPDVIGVYEKGGIPTEIVTAEIKDTDNLGLLVPGFGQACAYLEFSHKVSLVVPYIRGNHIRHWCERLGIGLVYFKPEVDAPIYEMVLRAHSVKPPNENELQGLIARIPD